MGDQIVIGLGLHLNGWDSWHKFFGPITEKSKGKLMQCRIYSQYIKKLLWSRGSLAGIKPQCKRWHWDKNDKLE